MGFVVDKKPISIENGEGVYVYDEEGTEYLDFGASYAVTVTGHNHPKVVEAIKNQADNLMYIFNSYPNSVRQSFEEKVAEVSPHNLSNVWLSNSGTEANEAALKFARSSTNSSKIVAAKKAFHGRTTGSLSASWKKKYRKPFQPLLDVDFVDYNNEEDLADSIDSGTAALILEPIQGAGGIHTANKEYLERARELTKEHNAALIFDEVQTGLGRTGAMWRCEKLGVEPDILTSAKGLASGMPAGATITKDWIADDPGPHGSTFGGNPVVAAAGKETLSVIQDENLPQRAAEMSEKLFQELERLQDENGMIRELRGEGLMIGIEVRRNANSMLKQLAIQHQVLALPTGRTVLRLLPSLIVDERHLKQFVNALEEVVSNY